MSYLKIFLEVLLLLGLINCQALKDSSSTATITAVSTIEQVPLSVDSCVLEFLGQKRYQILAHPDQVIARSLEYYETDSSQQKLRNFPITSQPLQLDSNQVLQFQNPLLDRKSYSLDGIYKKCMFTPDISLTFTKAIDSTRIDTLDVLLSFRCKQWRFYHEDSILVEDFDSVKDSLFFLFKKNLSLYR